MTAPGSRCADTYSSTVPPSVAREPAACQYRRVVMGGKSSSRLSVGVKVLRCAPAPVGRPMGDLDPDRRLLWAMKAG